MLLWTDIETTGLSVARDLIIEIAMTLTDDDLKVIGDPFSVVIKQNVNLANLDPKVVAMHSSNGLWTEVVSSKKRIEDAYYDMIRFFEKNLGLMDYKDKLKSTMMAGSSVHFDRAWLMRDFDSVVDMLNYRIIDVSTIKSLAYKWAPRMLEKLPFSGESNHRAGRDVEISLAQARYFKDLLFS